MGRRAAVGCDRCDAKATHRVYETDFFETGRSESAGGVAVEVVIGETGTGYALACKRHKEQFLNEMTDRCGSAGADPLHDSRIRRVGREIRWWACWRQRHKVIHL